jgi:hypothetical protein
MALVPYNRMIRAYRETGKYVIRVENEQALGTYATKERALQVLDEIERHVVGKLFLPNPLTEDYKPANNSYIYMSGEFRQPIEYLPKVYQMPEE